MKRLLKITGLVLGIICLAVVGAIVYITTALPDVGPAPVITVDKGAEHVARGKYLATHVMVCVDCHSTRNWKEFSGPVTAGTLGKGGDVFDQKMGFPGVYYAANITPAGIADYTDGELFRAITTGVKRDGSVIFPVMPHTHYGKMDESDIKDVIAYVRTLEPIENKVPASHSDFPMNIIIHTIPEKPAFTKRPDTTDLVAYGGYLVNAGACYDCHTPFDKGAYDNNFAFAGGRVFPMPGGTLRSANITSDATGIGSWTKEAFLQRFAMHRDSVKTAPNPDQQFNTIMPWTMYAGMTDQDLGAIYEYLKTLKPINHPVTKFSPGP
ncbi:c-type cytochrome [Chryseolinea lacunae]|uniref:C-type cytochrome n=1 Tax=Chryseolinea lacunae TaxID=2801331 RepID=A0ABS1KND6_9BACT|nr:c-type cytochrome [Chryseolinea lacunae]MBL0740969.1 c-type cytochrome [Chryseolinea lacunae]